MHEAISSWTIPVKLWGVYNWKFVWFRSFSSRFPIYITYSYFPKIITLWIKLKWSILWLDFVLMIRWCFKVKALLNNAPSDELTQRIPWKFLSLYLRMKLHDTPRYLLFSLHSVILNTSWDRDWGGEYNLMTNFSLDWNQKSMINLYINTYKHFTI